MKTKLSLIIALLLTVIIFTLQNTETVSIQFLFWQFSLSRALMLFLMLAIGIVLGFFLCAMQNRHNADDTPTDRI